MKTMIDKIALLIAVMMFATVGLASTQAAAASGVGGVVNVNTATVHQLQYLKGIGAKKAQAIVEFRAQHKFNQVDELTKVRGIGKKLVEKLRSFVVTRGKTTMTPPPKKKRKGKKKSD